MMVALVTIKMSCEEITIVMIVKQITLLRVISDTLSVEQKTHFYII